MGDNSPPESKRRRTSYHFKDFKHDQIPNHMLSYTSPERTKVKEFKREN